jgi:hypothetical protein
MEEVSSRTTPRRVACRRTYDTQVHVKMMQELSVHWHAASHQGRRLGLHAAVYG